MNVLINKKDMSVSVIKDKQVLKKESIDKDRYKQLMIELSGERVDMLRTMTKLFKPTRYEFCNVNRD